jgi:hypothetical protein
LTYLKDGNVFVSPADGGAAAQVTTNGTPSSPYAAGSQSAAGMVVVNSGRVAQRLAQSGQRIAAPVSVGGYGVADRKQGGGVSPDGRNLAIVSDQLCGISRLYFCSATYLLAFAEPKQLSGSSLGLEYASWANNDTVVGVASCDIQMLRPGQANEWWAVYGAFDSPLTGCAYGAGASADGRRLAAYAATDGYKGRALLLFTAAGFGERLTARCVQPMPWPGGVDAHPVWSPDGTAIAWEQADGIWTQTVTDLTGSAAGCEANARTARLVIPGGTQPHWSAAPYDPRPLPDRDGDGLPDAYDACPDGPAASANGCAPAPRPQAAPPAPAPTRPIDPTPPPSMRIAGTLRLRRTIRSGLPITVICPADCSARATAQVSAATAKRLRLARRAVTVASGELRSARGSATLNLTFARRVRARLQRARSVRLTVRAWFASSTGQVTATAAVTVR